MTGKEESESESLMEFPCVVDIKVFVQAREELQDEIRALLAEQLESEQILGIRQRASSGGKYHSLSCQIKASDRAQLDRIFTSLSKHPDVLMVL